MTEVPPPRLPFDGESSSDEDVITAPANEVLRAVCTGDVEGACQLVASRDLSEDTLTELLLETALHHTLHHQDIEARIRFVRLLLTRGANPNCPFLVTSLTTAAQTHETTLICQISTSTCQYSPRVIDLLITWGAYADHTRHTCSKITYLLANGGKETYRYSVLAYAVAFARQFRRLRAVALALLSGGSTLDACVRIRVKDAQGAQVTSRSESIEWVLGERERRKPSLVNNEHYLAFKAFLLSVRAAGDYRSFVIEQRRSCALMRHLAIRGRATTHDGPLGFLARTGEAGLFRRVLSYLPPRPLPRPSIRYHIRIRRADNGEVTYFRVEHDTTKLANVFRAWVASLEDHPYTAQWAFSLPASPEVLLEGFQTGADLGLKDDDVIDAMLYAEHPAGLREQAAAAADAARQYLEHLRADERFRGAEDAEEAIAHAAAAMNVSM